MRREELKIYKDKLVGVLYIENNQEVFLRGHLIDLTNSSITLRTEKNILTLSLDSIKKIKFSLEELK